MPGASTDVDSAPKPHPERIFTRQDFGREMRHLRVRGGRAIGYAPLTIRQIAAASGIPRSTVASYLAGKTLPSAAAVAALIHALGADEDLPAWLEAVDRLRFPLDVDPPVMTTPEPPGRPQAAAPLPPAPAAVQQPATMHPSPRTRRRLSALILLVTALVGGLSASESPPDGAPTPVTQPDAAYLTEPTVLVTDAISIGDLTARLEMQRDRGGALHAECWTASSSQLHRIRACNIMNADGLAALTSTESGDPSFPLWSAESHSIGNSISCREVPDHGHVEVLFDIKDQVTRATISGRNVKISC
jgi:transcriptional regulator with XRE-family HTH domain